jgi:hypothetical protein
MMLAVRVARTLKRTTEAEMRLPRIANRPAAVVALKIDELFRFIASGVSGHALARARGPPAASWCDRWEVVDVPAEGGIIGRPAAWRTPKRKRRGNGWETFFASTCPATPTCMLKSHPPHILEATLSVVSIMGALWRLYDAAIPTSTGSKDCSGE